MSTRQAHDQVLWPEVTGAWRLRELLRGRLIQEVSGGGDFLGLRGSRQRDQHKQSLEEGGAWSGKENQQVLARGQREATAAPKVRDVGQARPPSPARVWTQSAIKANSSQPSLFI